MRPRPESVHLDRVCVPATFGTMTVITGAKKRTGVPLECKFLRSGNVGGSKMKRCKCDSSALLVGPPTLLYSSDVPGLYNWFQLPRFADLCLELFQRTPER
jgi:hypothetical protein